MVEQLHMLSDKTDLVLIINWVISCH